MACITCGDPETRHGQCGPCARECAEDAAEEKRGYADTEPSPAMPEYDDEGVNWSDRDFYSYGGQ